MTDATSRPLTSAESALVRALLARVGLAASNAAHIEDLRVVAHCECGCSSIDFTPRQPKPPVGILADCYAMVPEGFAVGIILWGTEEALAGLEVYSLADDPPYGTPLADTLCDVPPSTKTEIHRAFGATKTT